MTDNGFVITNELVEGGAVRFSVKGRVNSITAPVLKYKLEEAIQHGERVNLILNMMQVEYLSSNGISTILSVYKQAEEAGGKFGIEQPSEVVRNVLGMTALDKMLIV